MTTKYICDKCGAQFDDYSDAWAHESRHTTPDTINRWDAPDIADLAATYGPESLDPEVIYLKALALDDAGDIIRNDDGEATWRVIAYKRDTHHRAQCDKLAALLNAKK